MEREERTYTYLPIPSRNASDAMPELATRTITRYLGGASRTYSTAYTYAPADFANYHRPTQIVESGDLARTTTHSYQHLATPFVVGLPLSESVTVGNQSFARSWTYNPATGFRASETVAGITTTFEADFGNVRKATRANGKWTSFAYSNGQVSQTTTPEYFVSREIDPDGTVKSETRAGRKTSYTYDDAGRPRITTPPGASPIETQYDPAGTWVKTTRGNSVTTTTLDGFGRPIETLSGAVRTVIQYDAEGRKTYESLPFASAGIGTGTVIEYDHLDRVEKETNPGGTVRLRTYSLDTMTVQDEKGRQSTYTPSAFGHPDDTRLTALQDAKGETWTYEYNVTGALTAARGSGGVSRTWGYDTNHHLLVSESHPESGTVSYAYDAAGVLKQKPDARGTLFKYTYDGNDRVRSITAGTRVTQVAYEPGSDNRSSTSVAGQSSAFMYDTAGRLQYRTDAIDGRTFTTRFQYDGKDNLTDITYPSGRHVRYEFNAENRITRVLRAATTQNYATAFDYHPSGALATYRAGNNILTTVNFATPGIGGARFTREICC